MLYQKGLLALSMEALAKDGMLAYWQIDSVQAILLAGENNFTGVDIGEELLACVRIRASLESSNSDSGVVDADRHSLLRMQQHLVLLQMLYTHNVESAQKKFHEHDIGGRGYLVS